MASLDEAFGTVANTDMWEEATAAIAGFLAPSVLRNITEDRFGLDAPDEIYGVSVVALGHYSPMYGEMISLGGGMYTVDALLRRFGLKGTITELGGN